MRLLVSALLAMLLAGMGYAHRLDEYLQATLLAPDKDGVEVQLQLTPGVAVLPLVLPLIDRNSDGRISPEEETSYARWVANDLELRLDGRVVSLEVIEKEFSSLDQMREGLGGIRLKLRGKGYGRELRFKNRHLPELSAYLVNCLASEGLSTGTPMRDEAQRSIGFVYSVAGAETLSRLLYPAAFGLAGLGALLSLRRVRSLFL